MRPENSYRGTPSTALPHLDQTVARNGAARRQQALLLIRHIARKVVSSHYRPLQGGAVRKLRSDQSGAISLSGPQRCQSDFALPNACCYTKDASPQATSKPRKTHPLLMSWPCETRCVVRPNSIIIYILQRTRSLHRLMTVLTMVKTARLTVARSTEAISSEAKTAEELQPCKKMSTKLER